MKFCKNKMANNEEGGSLPEHRMEINIIDKTLRDIYYNPETGYQSVNKLFKDIQKYNFELKRNVCLFEFSWNF